jgi:hypothetical protein
VKKLLLTLAVIAGSLTTAPVAQAQTQDALEQAEIAQLAAAGIEVKRQATQPVRAPFLPATAAVGEVSCYSGQPAFYEGVLYSQPNATGTTQGIQFCNHGACDAAGYTKNLVEMGGPWWGGGVRSFWWNAYNNCPNFEFQWRNPNVSGNAWITSQFRNGPFVVNVWAPYPTQVRYVRYYAG